MLGADGGGGEDPMGCEVGVKGMKTKEKRNRVIGWRWM